MFFIKRLYQIVQHAAAKISDKQLLFPVHVVQDDPLKTQAHILTEPMNVLLQIAGDPDHFVQILWLYKFGSRIKMRCSWQITQHTALKDIGSPLVIRTI